jgi:large subunit ribosomal protein L30
MPKAASATSREDFDEEGSTAAYLCRGELYPGNRRPARARVSARCERLALPREGDQDRKGTAIPLSAGRQGSPGRSKMAKLRITYIKSSIGYNQKQKATVEALGLRKLHQVVVHADSLVIRGMVNRVSHLVRVEEVAE